MLVEISSNLGAHRVYMELGRVASISEERGSDNGEVEKLCGCDVWCNYGLPMPSWFSNYLFLGSYYSAAQEVHSAVYAEYVLRKRC